jgi:hypothetical protein
VNVVSLVWGQPLRLDRVVADPLAARTQEADGYSKSMKLCDYGWEFRACPDPIFVEVSNMLGPGQWEPESLGEARAALVVGTL